MGSHTRAVAIFCFIVHLIFSGSISSLLPLLGRADWGHGYIPNTNPFSFNRHGATKDTEIRDGCTYTHSNLAFESRFLDLFFFVLCFYTLVNFGAHEATNGPKQKWSQLDCPPWAVMRLQHGFLFCVHIRRTDQRSRRGNV